MLHVVKKYTQHRDDQGSQCASFVFNNDVVAIKSNVLSDSTMLNANTNLRCNLNAAKLQDTESPHSVDASINRGDSMVRFMEYDDACVCLNN